MSEFTPGEARQPEKKSPLQKEALLRDELEHGERLLWWGAAKPGLAVLASFGIFFFAIPWTAFAIFWTVMAYTGVSQIPVEEGKEAVGVIKYAFPLFGLPFIIIGLGMFASPLWAMRKAKKTLYAITNQRALTMCYAGKKEVTSHPFADWAFEIKRKESRDGSGSLIFYPNGFAQLQEMMMKRIPFKVPDGLRPRPMLSKDSDAPDVVYGFEGVDNVKKVETILLRALSDYKQSKEGPGSLPPSP